MTTYYPQLLRSRLLSDADRSVLAGDDADVTAWIKTNKFILATQIGYDGKDTAASAYKLQWRNVTDAGSFADVGVTGECKYSSSSGVLADGTAVTSTTRKCTAASGQTWQNGLENLADNLLPDSSTLDLASDCYTEFQWGLDLSGAHDGDQYEFRLWNNTSGATVGTCLAQITTQSVTNLTVADCAQAQTCEAPVLVQKYTVAVQDASQGQAADNVVVVPVTPPTNLTVADAAQGQSVEAGVLTQKHLLTVADLAQGQSADAPALTQKHILTVEDAVQAQSVESPNLIQKYVLTAGDLDQAQTVDGNLTLEEIAGAIDLILADLSQSSALENAVIQLIYIMSAQDLAQEPLLDGLSVTQTHILATQDVDQGQSVETCLLTQKHNLTSQELTQNQTTDEITLGLVGELMVENMGQTQGLDSILLTQKHNLSVQDLGQAQGVDPAVLSLIYQLQAADLVQAQNADSPELAQERFIIGQDCHQAPILDDVHLNVGLDLVVADLVQGQQASYVLLCNLAKFEASVAARILSANPDFPTLIAGILARQLSAEVDYGQ
jgi:hypothetical protein